MKNYLRSIFFLLTSICSNFGFSQWADFNPGIVGDFEDIDVYGATWYICGNTGIFESDDIITWTEISVFDNETDSLIYEQTHFYGLASFSYGGEVLTYASGIDTISGDGVVFFETGDIWYLDLTVEGHGLRDVSTSGIRGFVVGENGTIFVKNCSICAWLDYSYDTEQNLLAIETISWEDIIITGDSIVLTTTSMDYDDFDSVHFYTLFDVEKFEDDFYYGVGYSYVSELEVGTDDWELNSAFPSDLDGNGMMLRSSGLGFIGTQNGVLTNSDIMNEPWEILPSSVGFDVRELKQYGDWTYAVGHESTMIRTYGISEVTYPYVEFTGPIVACKDSLFTYGNMGNTENTYSWYIDDVFQSSDYDFDHSFTELGLFELKLVVDNEVYIDSIIKTIQVINTPSIDLSINLSDSILCKVGEVTITLSGTDLNAEYALFNLQEDEYASEFIVGSGGEIEFNTGELEDSTSYLIKVRGISAACETQLADTILIAVEHTNADFFVSNINSAIESPVNFFNHSRQASNYQWTIYTPDEYVDSSYEFIHHYSEIGQYAVRLIVESEYGCLDTIIKNGPFVYDTSNMQPSCWALAINGETEVAYDHDRIRDIAVDEAGNIYAVGSQDSSTYETKYGLDGFTSYYGSFIAKYDPFGVLQWKIDCDQRPSEDFEDPVINNSRYGDIYDVEISDEGNIYVSGWYDRFGAFALNNGDTLVLSEDVGRGFVLKLDSLGSYLWHVETRERVLNMVVAKDEYLFISGYSDSPLIPWIKGADGLLTNVPPAIPNFYIARLDFNGIVNFATRTVNNKPYETSLNEGFHLAVDSDLNLYIGASYEPTEDPYISSIDLPDTLIEWPSMYGTFIAQYDSSGNFKWITSIYDAGIFDVQFDGIDIDEDDNVYALTYTNNPFSGNSNIKDAVGTTYESTLGEYILFSLDSEGIHRWTSGIERGGANSGALCVKDNTVYTASYIIRSGIPTTSWFVSADVFEPYTYFWLPTDVNVNFNAWTLDGTFLWHAYPDGQQTSSIRGDFTHKNIAVDNNGNIIFGSYSSGPIMSAYQIAGDTLDIAVRSSILAKFSPGMCANNISRDTPYKVCVGDSVEIAFNLSALDFAEAGNSFYLTLTDNVEFPDLIDTIGILESTNPLDTIIGLIPDVPDGSYFLWVSSSDPFEITFPYEIIIHKTPEIGYFDTTLCKGDTISYNAVLCDSYLWTPELGVSNPDGRNVLLYPEVSNLYVLEMVNVCGTFYDTLNFEVISADVEAGSDTSICITDSLFLNATGPSDISWSNDHPNGTFFHPIASVVLIAIGENEGCYSTDTIEINVEEIPNPIISKVADTLMVSDFYEYYQWYLDDSFLPGEIDYYHVYSSNGYYTVRVGNLPMCIGVSEYFHIIDLGYEQNNLNEPSIHPNPSIDKMIIHFGNNLDNRSFIQIYNSMGQKVYYSEKVNTENFQINQSDIGKGAFMAIVYNTEGLEIYSWKIIFN